MILKPLMVCSEAKTTGAAWAQHWAQHTDGRRGGGGCADGGKQPWKLSLSLDSLCNVFLCQVAHYANTLFTVGVTVSRHESRWGPRAAAHYQERRRSGGEDAAKGM